MSQEIRPLTHPDLLGGIRGEHFVIQKKVFMQMLCYCLDFVYGISGNEGAGYDEEAGC